MSLYYRVNSFNDFTIVNNTRHRFIIKTGNKEFVCLFKPGQEIKFTLLDNQHAVFLSAKTGKSVFTIHNLGKDSRISYSKKKCKFVVHRSGSALQVFDTKYLK